MKARTQSRYIRCTCRLRLAFSRCASSLLTRVSLSLSPSFLLPISLQKARHKKGEDRPGRTARLAKIGNDALKSMFGAAPKKTVVQGFNVLAAPGLGDGGGNMTLMTKQTFETVDKCEEAYSEARGM